MSRKTAFDAYLKTGDDLTQRAIGLAIGPLHAYLEKASLKDLSRLAAAGKPTLEGLRVAADPNALQLLPGSPSMELLTSLAGLSPEVLAFLAKTPAGRPHLARARSRIDASQVAVTSWFDDWKDHSTGMLDVHKGILDGTHKTGGDMFAALATETVSIYATAFNWLLRPYTKKK